MYLCKSMLLFFLFIKTCHVVLIYAAVGGTLYLQTHFHYKYIFYFKEEECFLYFKGTEMYKCVDLWLVLSFVLHWLFCDN